MTTQTITTTKSPKVKLTKAMRDEFVDAVLAGIKADLDTDAIRKMATEEAVSKLPAAVRTVYDNIDTRYFVTHSSVYFPSVTREVRNKQGWPQSVALGSVSVPGYNFKPSAALMQKAQKLMQAAADKLDEKDRMRERLTAMAGACKNTEELEEMFPALTKYIPKPVVVPRSMVPMVQIKDTMKELRRLGVPPKQEAVTA